MNTCAAVFLDRDGTINVDKGYVYKVEDFEFLPGAIEGMRLLSEKGFKLIIITNQSGLARGYYTKEQYYNLQDWMLTELDKYGINITDILFCPHLPNAIIDRYQKECNCRKPGIELFSKAQRKWNIDFNKSFAIGDKMRDLSICQSTGCKGYLITESEKFDKESMETNIKCVNSLYSAALRIVEE